MLRVLKYYTTISEWTSLNPYTTDGLPLDTNNCTKTDKKKHDDDFKTYKSNRR